MTDKKPVESKFEIKEFMNRVETDTRIFTLLGAKALVQDDGFALRASKALAGKSDGEHEYLGVKVRIETK